MLRSIEENRRLSILRRYAILDTPPEEVFDRIARMAASHFATPIGIVSFVDETRQWFKAVHGIELRETGRDIAFCAHTIKSDKPLIIPDTERDERFLNNPLVVELPRLRFYAGAPLVTAEGERLGTVAAIDTAPHPTVRREDCDYLADLAAIVVHELEMRLAASDFKSEIERRFQSEQRLQLSVAHAPIVLATLDRDLRYTWVTNLPPPLTPADLLGRQDRDLWPPEIAEPHMALKREVMATVQNRRTEFSTVIGGTLRHFDVTVEPLLEGGQVVGVAYAAMDITARKTAEMDLARSEARYRSVLDTAADAVVVIDEAGIVSHYNPAAERIFGYAADEVVGRDVAMLMSEPDRSAHAGYLKHYLRTGEAQIIGIGREVVGQRKDGSVVPLDLSIAEWWDGGKRYFTGIMRDIGRRKSREAALRKAEAERQESLALLHTMLEGIPDPLFYKDRGGRYIFANQATARALGVETVIGKTDAELLPASEAHRLRMADLEVLARGTPKVVEEAVSEGPGGLTRWYHTSRFPLRDETGDITGVVGLARDITERRAMVQQLKDAKEQAEAANRAKTSFLAAASHDLRQPVQALVLFSSVLQGRLKGHPAAQVVGRMKQSVDALQMLLESLLDISKLDAGVITANPEPCALAEICTRLGREYALPAHRKGLHLRVARCDYWTLTDPTLMERVVRNLVENAIRYTERGGILIGCRARGDRLALQVIDTGAGIPGDQIEAIFQEFHQLGNPERDRAKGLGLGLSIVRRLLALLGHELAVISVVGRGSCFSIDLPRIDGAALPLNREHAAHDGETGDKTVLVIDDEAIVRQGLEVLLRDWGYGVMAAADAEEALDHVAEQGPPDAIIADYRLQGGRTGTEAVVAVQRACGRSLPAIIVTGDTAPERIAEVQRSGHTIAHKPISGENLRVLVRNALAHG